VITNTGKSIIGKYLLGNTPSYASYIAVGCGATPLDTADSSGDYSTKTNLDFEMFRVPISSKGFVNEGGVEFNDSQNINIISLRTPKSSNKMDNSTPKQSTRYMDIASSIDSIDNCAPVYN
jgi:hypothetical protein